MIRTSSKKNDLIVKIGLIYMDEGLSLDDAREKAKKLREGNSISDLEDIYNKLINTYFKVKILSCSCLNLWYSNKIGEVILVKKDFNNKNKYIAKNGSMIISSDVKLI